MEIKLTIHLKRKELIEDIYIHINYKQQYHISLVLFCYCAYVLCILPCMEEHMGMLVRLLR